jgi:hypothetical protein
MEIANLMSACNIRNFKSVYTDFSTSGATELSSGKGSLKEGKQIN